MNFIFPGGAIRNIVVPATAGNAPTTLTPGNGKRWRLLRSSLYLTCDVTVANRYLRLQPRTGGGVVSGPILVSAVVVASAGVVLSISPVLVLSGGSIAGSHFGIGQSFLFGPTDQIYIDVTAGVAGDSYSGIITVLEASE